MEPCLNTARTCCHCRCRWSSSGSHCRQYFKHHTNAHVSKYHQTYQY